MKDEEFFDEYPFRRDFKVKVWPKGEQIDLMALNVVREMKPIECHIKPDGSVFEKPSLCFVLVDPFGRNFVAQISAEMLRPVIAELAELARSES